MVNIWMIYHTKTGTCQKVCEDIATKLNGGYEIRTDEVKKIKEKDISGSPPDVLLVGSRITFDKPDRTITKFVKKLGKKLNSPIPKAATFYTHMTPWEDFKGKMGAILKENNVAKEILPEYLEFKIQDTGKTSGPPEPGQEPKIDAFVGKVRNFIGS
jgi:flavodoxin